MAALADGPRQERHEIQPFTPDEAKAFLEAAKGQTYSHVLPELRQDAANAMQAMLSNEPAPIATVRE